MFEDKKQDISKLANISLAGTHAGLDNRIKQIKFNWNTNGIKANGTFSYLAFQDNRPTQDEFINFIYYKIIPFCLPRKYIKYCRDKLKETGNERWFHEPVDAAKQLFIKAKEKNVHSGEPGEVVLFTFLEGLLGAPRIVTKMNLKTNSNMEVYGSDAIHMKYDDAQRCLTIYWGEAKLYSELSNALEKIAESIKNFRDKTHNSDSSQRDFDIQIIQNHHDLDSSDDETTQKALLAFLDPYSEYYNDLKEVHACLAIWNWNFYKELSNYPPDQAENIFKNKYLERIKTACNLFLNKIENKSLKAYRFHFFLLPISDIVEFRNQFCKKIGLPVKEAGE